MIDFDIAQNGIFNLKVIYIRLFQFDVAHILAYTDTLNLYRHALLGPNLKNVQYFRKFNSSDELMTKIILQKY